MYQTYYIPNAGQPKNGIEDHVDLADALNAWADKCGATLNRQNGRACVDLDGETILSWHQNKGYGAYAAGSLIDGKDGSMPPAEIAALLIREIANAT